MVIMKILLVEPAYRRSAKTPSIDVADSSDHSKNTRYDDDTLWYPPIGLLKLARFHNLRGDEVRFVSGCDETTIIEPNLFELKTSWDRVYITTLFTFDFNKIVK